VETGETPIAKIKRLRERGSRQPLQFLLDLRSRDRPVDFLWFPFGNRKDHRSRAAVSAAAPRRASSLDNLSRYFCISCVSLGPPRASLAHFRGASLPFPSRKLFISSYLSREPALGDSASPAPATFNIFLHPSNVRSHERARTNRVICAPNQIASFVNELSRRCRAPARWRSIRLSGDG